MYLQSRCLMTFFTVPEARRERHSEHGQLREQLQRAPILKSIQKSLFNSQTYSKVIVQFSNVFKSHCSILKRIQKSLFLYISYISRGHYIAWPQLREHLQRALLLKSHCPIWCPLYRKCTKTITFENQCPLFLFHHLQVL